MKNCKSKGLRMATGGVLEESAALRHRMAEKYGVTTGDEAAQTPSQPQAPTGQAQPTQPKQGGLRGLLSSFQRHFDQVDKAANMAKGGIVVGKHSDAPKDSERREKARTADQVPVNLSIDEAVLPAKTVDALGGPEAVEELIEQTNGKEPVTKGLRAGGNYAGGVVDDFGDMRTSTPNTGSDVNAKRVIRAQQAASASAPPTPAEVNYAPRSTTPVQDGVTMGQKVTPTPQRPNWINPNTQVSPYNPQGSRIPNGAKFHDKITAEAMARGNQNRAQGFRAAAGAEAEAGPGAARTVRTPEEIGRSIGRRLAPTLNRAKAIAPGLGDVAGGGLAVAGEMLNDDQNRLFNDPEAPTSQKARALGRAALRNAGGLAAGSFGAGLGSVAGPVGTVGGAVAGGTAGYKLTDKLGEAVLGDPVGEYAKSKPAAPAPAAPTDGGGIHFMSPEEVAAAKNAHDNVMGGGVGQGAKGPVGIDPEKYGVKVIPGGALDQKMKGAAKDTKQAEQAGKEVTSSTYNPETGTTRFKTRDDATSKNFDMADGTGIMTRSPGKDGLRQAIVMGPGKQFDENGMDATDRKYAAAGYGKDAYGNWMTPARQELDKRYADMKAGQAAATAGGPSVVSTGGTEADRLQKQLDWDRFGTPSIMERDGVGAAMRMQRQAGLAGQINALYQNDTARRGQDMHMADSAMNRQARLIEAGLRAQAHGQLTAKDIFEMQRDALKDQRAEARDQRTEARELQKDSDGVIDKYFTGPDGKVDGPLRAKFMRYRASFGNDPKQARLSEAEILRKFFADEWVKGQGAGGKQTELPIEATGLRQRTWRDVLTPGNGVWSPYGQVATYSNGARIDPDNLPVEDYDKMRFLMQPAN